MNGSCCSCPEVEGWPQAKPRIGENGLLVESAKTNVVIYGVIPNEQSYPDWVDWVGGFSVILIPVALAFVFGSVAKGKEGPHSDVDVFVQALAATHERLGREVNPLVMSRGRLGEKIAASDPFVARVLSEPRIMLIGSERDLE